MNFKFKIIAFALLILVVSCAKNPFTGKSTMALVPNSEIFPSAFQQYNQFLSENKVIKGTADAKRIETIGTKIKTASERWLTANGHADYLEGYAWEYKLVDSKEVNAWCMPGGKIVFYTGILPICKDDAGIAAVMGHEVAHALANHGQQRMSAGLLQQLGAVGTQVAVGNKDPQTQALIMQAYGVGSQVGGMIAEADIIQQTNTDPCFYMNVFSNETQVTIYKYEPGTALLIEIIDAKCDSLHYVYDDLHRLQMIIDKQGNILQEFDLSFKRY